MTLPIGTGTFTNGSSTVTSVSFSSGSAAFFQSGTQLAVDSNPQIATVEAISAGASTITLRNNWDLPTGTYTFVASMTSEGLRDAAQTVRDLANSADANPTADSLAQRDSSGRVKTSNAVASNDAVALGQTGTAYNKNVQTSPTDTTAGRVLLTGAGGLLTPEVTSGNTADNIDTTYITGIYRVIGTSGGVRPPGVGTSTAMLFVQNWGVVNDNRFVYQIYYAITQGKVFQRKISTNAAANAWSTWREIYQADNILGTVSQSGGVPTGAIFQRGSNANGRFTRYADGSVIMDNSNAAITTDPTTTVGTVTSVDGDKLKFGYWF